MSGRAVLEQRAPERGWWKLPALSGALVGVSYLPGPFLALNLAGFVPLLAWLEQRHGGDRAARFRAGLVFGVLTHLIAQHFQYSMLRQSWLAVLLYLGMSALFGLRIALTVLLLGWLRRGTGLTWALLLPIVWLPFDWAATWGDLRMTGEHLAHTVAGYPFLVQFADCVGPYGVTAVLLIVNGLIFEALYFRRAPTGWRAAAGLGALLIAVLGYDTWAWTRPANADRTLRVALIQPNIPLAIKHGENTDAEQWRTLFALSAEGARQRADLIVWPESARPVPLYHRLDRPETYAMPEVQALARRLGTALLVGVEYVRARSDDEYDLYNAAMLVDAEGRLHEQWGAKVYLVPFVEHTPFRQLLGPLVRGRGGEWQWLAGGFEPGPTSALLDIDGTRVGVLVCFEQLFSDLARNLRNAGAELQVVITNDAWFGRSLFQPYQANALRLRAIENRSAFVRVANTGISGFVDSKGRYHQQTQLFEQAVEVRDVALASRRSIYDHVGDVVAWVALAGLAATIALAWRGVPASAPRRAPSS